MLSSLAAEEACASARLSTTAENVSVLAPNCKLSERLTSHIFHPHPIHNCIAFLGRLNYIN